MTLHQKRFSLDHALLLDSLTGSPNLLLIQDLDGVCMGLVRDPLSRRVERSYLEAARQLAGQFYVLTNGEHIGRRGMNRIVEQALGSVDVAQQQGWYLPGLAAGGVQRQDRYGAVSHPGVSDGELKFLRTVPALAAAFLAAQLSDAAYGLSAEEIHAEVEMAVLENLVSPTLNLNGLYQRYQAQPDCFAQLQLESQQFMQALLHGADAQGLSDSFFIHYAPNLGRDEEGFERMKVGVDGDAGSTDFQFMLKGAVKEVGVLVILNDYYHERTGRYPLGADFNARNAPREPAALLQLARVRFAPEQMPRIVAVGDTVTSQTADGAPTLRGGSDRGFLTLVQEIGQAFGSDNAVLYVDSSAGEVRRPGLNAEHLRRCAETPSLAPWPAVAQISDAEDPLRINFVFAGGHAEYLEFFQTLASRLAVAAA